MKSIAFLCIFVTLIGCFGCNRGGKNPQSIINSSMELSVVPGENWYGKMKIFIFSVKKTPQMAAWIEDDQGHYISTITVTNRSAKNNWRSAPREGRPEALPVWSHRIQNNMDQIDGVSSATPKGAIDVNVDNRSLIITQEYRVYLEINHSFDYNDTWPEKENDVNGQPSIIYYAQFFAGETGRIKLIPIGHGSIDGSDGNIMQKLEGITTALTIIKEAYLIIE